MTTTKALTGPLMQSGSRTVSRGVEYARFMFEKYGVKSYAVYVDHTTVVQDLRDVAGTSVYGYFTFDINLADKEINGQPVQVLLINGPLPDCDGWLIASTNRAAAFSLCKALLDTGNEDQVICRFYGGQTTEMDAYMDMFSGETETIMYLNHYFDRKYRIVFPLDVRYTVCECDGKVIKSGQRIMPPGGIIVLDSREMGLGDFEGYLRVELEVENLQVRVQPFIHFWADYISEAGICRNHQSGWAPWPQGTVFNRGYLPLDPNFEAIGSFYNANDGEITVKALLHYNQDDIEKTVERTLKPIPAWHMSYQNLSKIFQDISLEGVNAAYILFTGDKPLHRPNHYITVKGSKKFVDTFHQTGGKACHWARPSDEYQKKDLEKLERFGLESPWSVRLPILEERFNIETYLGLLSLTLCNLSECTFIILNEKGAEVFAEDSRIDGLSPHFMNVSEYARAHGVNIHAGGTFCMNPKKGALKTPKGSAVLFGLKHIDYSFISTSFRGSPAEVNLPFYIAAQVPHSREYHFSPMTNSDHFMPGVSSDAYDSLFIVEHQSLMKEYEKKADYRLDIFDFHGKQYTFQRTVGPKSYDTFWLSEVLAEAGIASDSHYYTLWVKSYGTKLKPFHLLYRKSDHALSFDDGSEGTLQTEPQIAGIEPEMHMRFTQFLRERGVLQSIPPSWREYIKKLKAGKQLGT